MKKRFKGKKKNFKKLIVLFFLVSIFIYSFFAAINFLYKNKLSKNDSLIVSLLFKNSTSSFDINNLKQLNNPKILIKLMLNQEIEEKQSLNVDSMANKQVIQTGVYIYNSHPTEEYNNTSLEAFAITPTVVTADYILKEYLMNRGINVTVERNSVVNILKENNWKYGYSYKASRILLEQAYKNDESLNIFIDLHRDSSKRNITTTYINDTSYAKILFVIGLEHGAYQKNLDFATQLNDMIKEKYPNLTRGIMQKKGSGVNGIYNQDFHPNTILLELGGPENTLEEINNTLKVFSDILSDYIQVHYE